MIENKKKVLSTKMDPEEDIDSDELEKQESVIKISTKKRKLITDDPIVKKKEKFEKNLYKQPTVEELNQLRETENLFHSNLFRLQIEEVLDAVKIKNSCKSLFEAWFVQFKNKINAIKDTKEVELNNDAFIKNCDIKVPTKQLPNDCVGTFKFSPPSNIIVGGSYLLDTVVGPDASIDILVEMPENVFQKIDSKNYRYMRKKAMYMTYIGSIMSKELAEEIFFVGSHSNPILKIVPSGDLGKTIVLYIHVVVQETAFKINKFTPEKNNVRLKWFFKKADGDDMINPPTPYYNSVILRDLTTLKINLQNAKMIKGYPNIRDGIILLKIWLKQREFCSNFESFNGHVITMFVLYLLFVKKLNTFMSSYQIVRNTWQHLAKINWSKEGITFCQEEKINERIVEYQRYYDCVFLDSTGFHNIAANILEETFNWISNQAEMSIECLNNTRVNSFQILFMQKVPFYNSFDHIICLYNLKALENILEANIEPNDKLNYGPNKYVFALKLILRYLKQGLGNKASAISVLPRKIKEWQVNDEIPNDLERIYIGLLLDPDFSFNIIEKGPSANLPEAESFRKFWGDKSELRRFKDGTICETVVWAKEKATLAQKRDVPKEIVKYLLKEKLKLFDQRHYFIFSNQMEEMLQLKGIKITKFQYGTEEASLQAINAFNSLEKELSYLTDLPLSINGVQGCSPLFRYTDVFPPLSSTRKPDEKNVIAGKEHLMFPEDKSLEETPMYLAPIEATVQLSTSGKWPDDLKALRMTKAAFHMQIAECLRNQHKLRAHGALDYIDVMKDGFVFRLRIAHQKEIGLIKQEVGEDGVIKYRDNEESLALEEKLFHLPRITGALYGLHCQHPSFGPACCLAKRWLASQLIDDSLMPDIGVELIMASLYLNSDPYKLTSAPQVAFLRFLEFFAREHWSTDPIIVNFNNEMTREEIVELENLFGTSRDTLPTLFISTPYDKQSSMWTRKAPNLVILNRISALAKESLRLVEIQLFNNNFVCCDPLFKPPVGSYDCLIKLKDSLNSRRYEAKHLGENLSIINLHPFKEHSKMKMPIIGFDPIAEYLKEMRDIYKDFALFFHDTYGGNIIGVLLKPQVHQEKDFKVSETHCKKLNDKKKLILNVSAMIEDFYILGKGLVETIDIQSKKINAI